jgi:hypothetical protein
MINWADDMLKVTLTKSPNTGAALMLFTISREIVNFVSQTTLAACGLAPTERKKRSPKD